MRGQRCVITEFVLGMIVFGLMVAVMCAAICINY